MCQNDDGFGTANIRELYKQMTAHGHDCYIVASATSQAGVGPRLEFTDIPKLTADAEWGAFICRPFLWPLLTCKSSYRQGRCSVAWERPH